MIIGHNTVIMAAVRLRSGAACLYLVLVLVLAAVHCFRRFLHSDLNARGLDFGCPVANKVHIYLATFYFRAFKNSTK